MVYHFEAQKFLRVCIPQRAKGRKRGRKRERAQSKGTEGQIGKKRRRVYRGRILHTRWSDTRHMDGEKQRDKEKQ